MKNIILPILLSFSFLSMQGQVIEADSMALVAFYNATSGSEWTTDTNWLSDSPVSEWHGVYIEEQRVSEISMYNNNLTGELPAIIGDLTGLQKLYLPSNALTGSIPAEIGNCIELNTLDLSDNELTGSFPIEIGQCQKLAAIIMYQNELSGSFPEVLLNLPDLWRLLLGDNNFSGEIPASLNTATKLSNLSLDRNDFSGQMISLKNLTEMTELHLRGNNLYGDIADIFKYNPNMYYLTMGDNHFTGCVSDTFFNPESLQFLDFPNNDFTCVGDFSAFSDTGVLKRINLFGNQLPFEDLEPNRVVFNYTYSPQQSLLSPDTIFLEAGDSTEIESGSLGLHTHYSWFKDGEEIPGESSPSLWVKEFDENKAGIYHCVMTNDSLPLLTLQRNPVTLMIEGASSVRNPKLSSISITPNPVSDFLYLPSDYSIGKASIYDQVGKNIGGNFSITDGKIEVSSLAPGVYIIIIQSQDKVASGRFIKVGG